MSFGASPGFSNLNAIAAAFDPGRRAGDGAARRVERQARLDDRALRMRVEGALDGGRGFFLLVLLVRFLLVLLALIVALLVAFSARRLGLRRELRDVRVDRLLERLAAFDGREDGLARLGGEPVGLLREVELLDHLGAAERLGLDVLRDLVDEHEVIAELALDDVRHLARLGLEHGLLEGFDHLALGHAAEQAALRRAAVLAHRARDVREALALVEPRLRLVDLLLGRRLRRLLIGRLAIELGEDVPRHAALGQVLRFARAPDALFLVLVQRDPGVDRLLRLVRDEIRVEAFVETSIRDRRLRLVLRIDRVRLGVADLHARAHEVAHARRDDLFLLVRPEILRAHLAERPHLALVGFEIELLGLPVLHRHEADHVLPHLEVGHDRARIDRAAVRQRDRRDGHRDVHPARRELRVQVLVRDRDPEPLGVLVEQVPLDEPLGRDPPQAALTQPLRLGAARRDLPVRGPVMQGRDARTADLDRAGRPRHELLPRVRAELQDEHDGDGDDRKAAQDA